MLCCKLNGTHANGYDSNNPVLDHLCVPCAVEDLKTQLDHTAGYQCLFILIDKINKSTLQ